MTEFELMAALEKKVVFVSDRGPSITAACRSFQSIHCFAHMMHNVVDNMLQKHPLVSAVAAIVKYFKSSGMNSIFEQTLKSYVSTRWSSVYRMLESVIKHWDTIGQQLRTRKVHLQELNSMTKEELIILRDFLKPFAVATSEIEATKRQTIDMVNPWFAKLKSHLTPKPADPEMIARLKSKGYPYWINNVQENIHIFHDIAVFLNPNMKSLKTFCDVRKHRVWSEVTKLMDNYMPIVIVPDDSSDDDNSRRISVDMSEAMSAFVDDSDEAGTSADPCELDEYKKVRVSGFENCLQWWQQNKDRFPRLYGVARFILAIPASSAGPERLFSTAGRLVKFRPNLRAEMVDEIIFLKSNYDLFGKKSSNDDNEKYVELVEHEGVEDEGIDNQSVELSD